MSIREQARAHLPHNHLLIGLMDQIANPGDTDPEKLSELLLSVSIVLCQSEHRRTWHWLVLWLLELVEIHPQNVHLMNACRLALARAAGAYPNSGENHDRLMLENLIRFYATRPEFSPPDDSYRIYVRTALNIYGRCGRPYDRRLLQRAACNVPWYELIADEQMIDAIPVLANHLGCTELIWPGWERLPKHSRDVKLDISGPTTILLDVIEADIRRMRAACHEHFIQHELDDFRNLKIGPSLLLEGFLLQFVAKM